MLDWLWLTLSFVPYTYFEKLWGLHLYPLQETTFWPPWTALTACPLEVQIAWLEQIIQSVHWPYRGARNHRTINTCLPIKKPTNHTWLHRYEVPGAGAGPWLLPTYVPATYVSYQPSTLVRPANQTSWACRSCLRLHTEFWSCFCGIERTHLQISGWTWLACIRMMSSALVRFQKICDRCWGRKSLLCWTELTFSQSGSSAVDFLSHLVHQNAEGFPNLPAIVGGQHSNDGTC